MKMNKFLLFLNANGISYDVCNILKGKRLNLDIMIRFNDAATDLSCMLACKISTQFTYSN